MFDMGWFLAGEELKTKWNDFVVARNGSFLQSWEWGEFQKNIDRKIWRLVYQENGEIRGAALLVHHDLPFKFCYLYCPRGPIVKSKINPPAGGQKSKIFEEFLEKIKEIGAKEKAIFLKIEPDENLAINVSEHGFLKSKKEIQPSETLLLDLTKTEEELQAEMKPKTRYNIGLAGRKGVVIKKIKNQKSKIKIEEFWRLLQETTRRERFRPHERIYYEKLLETRSENFSAELLFAEFQEKTIAAHLVIFFGTQAIYLHGASSREHKETMAPYLLHWETAKEARRRGCLTYDFWGVSETKWPGVTHFKRGFGGVEKKYPGAFDFVFDKFWYWVYNMVRKT